MVISKNKRIVDSHKSKSGSLKPKTRNPCNEVGKEMIIDPCFKNMLRKELAAEKRAKERVINSTETNVLQESAERSDGICMEVEGLEELDYVDNVVDNELSDFEDGMLESAEALVGVTRSMGNENSVKEKHVSTEIPSTSCAKSTVEEAKSLTDDKLASLPRVRNLFNQFWAEKMQELSTEGEKQNKTSNLVKSPSDTTIYTPALARLPLVNHDKCVNHGNLQELSAPSQILSQKDSVNDIISYFVDNVRIEQCQSELQEKERCKSSVNQDSSLSDARLKVEKALLETEKF